MARVLSLSEAKARLSQLVADCEKDEEELVITRNGRPAAVLLSADEYEGWRETRAILRNPSLIRKLDKDCDSWRRADDSLLRKFSESP